MTEWGARIIPLERKAPGHRATGVSFTMSLSFREENQVPLGMGKKKQKVAPKCQLGDSGWTQRAFPDRDGWAGGDAPSLAQLRLHLLRGRWIKFPPRFPYCPQITLLIFKPLM